MPITNAKIFPPIGVARVGNSPTDFFIGPEIPGDRTPPPGGYKDDECRIKRQAARFRIFGYDGDTLVGEITAADAEILWTVHMVHKKAAYRDSDPARAIDPGPRTLNGPNQSQQFDGGTFTYPGEAPIPVPLGEIRSDTDNRLIVLGGFGANGSPVTTDISGLYDARWYDDVADGPVSAQVTLNDGGVSIPVMGAWIIVGPPNFAPPIDNPTSLYDRLYDFQGLPEPATPSFTNDVYPILLSGINVMGVKNVGSAHGSWNMATLSDPSPAAQAARQAIFSRLSVPPASSDMPALSGDGELRQTQYNIMEKWKDGNFVNDWPGAPPVPDPNGPVTPDGLTKAALENCVGASFSPGIEAGSELLTATAIYIEPFRLDHSMKAAGDISKVMSVPWQSDFSACGGSWWPAARPVNVKPQGSSSYVDWRASLPTKEDMAAQWHTLGFVVREGDDFVMVGQCDTASVNLLTPALDFSDTPQGPGGLTRVVAKPVVFEVIAPGSAVNFEIVSSPAHPRISLIDGGPFSVGPTAANSVEQLLIPVKYETGTPGEELDNTVTIRNTSTAQEWTVDIHAGTIAPQNSAVALVLDRSGSMNEDRGDGAGSKISNLIIAAKIFVDVMLQGDGAGVVRYNHNAQKLEDITLLGPITDPFDAGRKTIKDRFTLVDLNPSGATSIGDGLETGRDALNVASGFDHKALVVLSDGKENSSKMIAEVADSIDNRTYAIGFGTPANTNVAALQNLSGNNGGYLLITGEISGANQFILQKYFLQILAGITNAEIVSDPQGTLYAQNLHEVPFRLNEADNGIDVILLSPTPQYAYFYLRTPDGRIIDPQQAESHASVDFVLSEGVSYYRLALPIEVEADRPEQGGTWTVLLRFADREQLGWMRERYGHLFRDEKQPRSIPYSVIVHSYSDLRFKAFSFQQGLQPGSLAVVNANITQYGLPLNDRSSFRAEITAPDGAVTTVPLAAQGDGSFALNYSPSGNGVHNVRVLASGQTLGGWAFQREQTFSVPVWEGGDQPYRPGDPADEDQQGQILCRRLSWFFIALFAVLFLVLTLQVNAAVTLRWILGILTIFAGMIWLRNCKPDRCRIVSVIIQAIILALILIAVALFVGQSLVNLLPVFGLLGVGAIAAGVYAYLRKCGCCR